MTIIQKIAIAYAIIANIVGLSVMGIESAEPSVINGVFQKKHYFW